MRNTPARERPAQLYREFLPLERTLFLLFSGWDLAPRGNGCVVENSVLIPWHMNATCINVQKSACLVIMMSEFCPSDGQQLELLATPCRFTHVALSNTAAECVPDGRCERRFSFPAPGGCGQRLGRALYLATASIRRLIHVRSAVWSKHLLNL